VGWGFRRGELWEGVFVGGRGQDKQQCREQQQQEGPSSHAKGSCMPTRQYSTYVADGIHMRVLGDVAIRLLVFDQYRDGERYLLWW